MRIKSSGGAAVAAAAALAVLFIAGGSAAAIHVVSSGFSAAPAPTAQPARVGTVATATVPATQGGTAGAGTATAPAGTPAPSSTAPLSTAPSSTKTSSATPAQSGTPTQSGTLTPSGAVPGASPALAALAASRAADEALPHSPQLLHQLAAPSSSSAAATNQATALTTVRGIDVASYQHQNGAAISWASVGRAGYKFAAIKTTEGNYYVNPYAISDIVSAMSAGLYATVYHFAIPNITTGAVQAQFALKYSKYRSGGRALPLMLDIEYDPYVSTDHTNECYGLSAAAMRTWISSFVSTARSATGQYPIIYTTANWWDTCTGSSTAFGADPMWVAAYGVSSPPMPAGWRAYTFWQYSSSGTVSGVSTSGGTDLSYFNPSVVGLIDPGSQASKGGAKVGMQVASLDALARATLKFTASGLPPGLSITAAGDITGTIKKGTAGAVKTYRATITAKNGAGATASATFSWQVTG
ncbi:MAG: GH25 family lysozyme [Trebonia sp.]|uniref:GH25 family lysozyme n=1 Tax=Trebonia sp. TaxID=2767075 RepID=UPI003BB0F4C6